jgi:hypothetical protein
MSGLSLSFQRYPLTGSPVLHDLPRSWGALPVVTAEPGRLLLPAPDGEGAWLGLVPERGRPAWAVRVVALLSPQGEVDLLTGRAIGEGTEVASAGTVPPLRSLPGVARGQGAWWPLTRTPAEPEAPSCVRLTVRARPAGESEGDTEPVSDASVQVELLDPVEFEERTGHAVPPLRPDAPYGGWRLP